MDTDTKGRVFVASGKGDLLMKKWLVNTLAVGCLLGVASSAWAVPMPPGSSLLLPPGTSSPAPWGSLTMVADMTSAYSTAPGPNAFSGTVHTIVYKEASGTLDFWYQVNGGPENHKIDRISIDSFHGAKTDMYWVLDPTILTPETLGNLGSVVIEKFTHLDPDVIGENFMDGLGNASSYWWVVRTDATNYYNATARLQDGAQATAPTLAPAPLPSSLVLLSTGMIGLAGGFVRRLRKVFVL
jgi:hypothetical protein